LLLAEVTQLGQHDGVQLESGRRAQLYLGDRIVACLGNRYAPDQFEGIAKIENGQDCELLAGGGVAGVVRHRHGRMRAATGLRVLGVLGDADGAPVNIARYALPLPEPRPCDRPAIPVMLVVGSSMNAGKTTACASLIHGLARNGWRVGAVKITGTGRSATCIATPTPAPPRCWTSPTPAWRRPTASSRRCSSARRGA
jgi:hypothetical protein